MQSSGFWLVREEISAKAGSPEYGLSGFFLSWVGSRTNRRVCSRRCAFGQWLEAKRIAASDDIVSFVHLNIAAMTRDNPSAPPAPKNFLGKTSPHAASPEAAILDYVPNPRAGGALFWRRFAVPEFTSLARLPASRISPIWSSDYAPPDQSHVEFEIAQACFSDRSAGPMLLSRKLHEVEIGRRLFDEIAGAKWLRNRRYCIRAADSIDVFWQSGSRPRPGGLPDQGVATLSGRG